MKHYADIAQQFKQAGVVCFVLFVLSLINGLSRVFGRISFLVDISAGILVVRFLS